MSLDLVLVLALAVVAWWRSERLFGRWLDSRKPVIPLDKADPMPADLALDAMGYSDEWARDQTLGALQEMRMRLGSWDVVRAHWHDMKGQAT